MSNLAQTAPWKRVDIGVHGKAVADPIAAKETATYRVRRSYRVIGGSDAIGSVELISKYVALFCGRD